MNKNVSPDMIFSCDLNRPYAFVSYSRKDKDAVWEDVCRLQRDGYNIWIDTNLNETAPSWQSEAMKAIASINCKLLIFYLSKNSILSAPCLAELRHKDSDEARRPHGGNDIAWIVVEVDRIENITSFRDETFNSIDLDPLMKIEEKNSKAATLADMMKDFFPDNDKIRIRRDEYDKIVKNLENTGIRKRNCEEMYRWGVELLANPASYPSAISIFANSSDNIADTYLPSVILLAFIHATGLCGARDEKKAGEELFFAELQKSESEWMAAADEYKKQGNLAEAAAFYSAAALKGGGAKAYLEAAKIWFRLENYEFTLNCAEGAVKLHSEEGKRFYNVAVAKGKEDFLQKIKSIKESEAKNG
ncbi:MAG: toll/interleukin-1 receptor domain-containing protein [Lachnospiraceae bacterium]|nr:toll/interleukin-1 receptor domain-containing protein [Lachnospiraceae bacterium]